MCIILCTQIFAQKHDNVWMFGAHNVFSPDSIFAINIVDFSNNVPEVTFTDIEYDFRGTDQPMCDSSGELLYYSNGLNIYDASHQLMLNGDSINPGYWANNTLIGYPVPVGSFNIRAPGHLNKYYFFHMFVDTGTLGVTHSLLYTIINMSGNNGLGEVVEKNIVAIPPLLQPVTTVRHANGRDWWIIAPEKWSKNYHYLLLDKNGITYKGIQTIPDQYGTNHWGGQSVFSPDGSKFIYYDPYNTVNIFDFNRCTGLLENYNGIALDTAVVGGVAAIAPNSRFLYFASHEEIYQIDLWSADIKASIDTVFVVDSMQPTSVYYSQLAPDGKIYMSATYSLAALHVIHNPNKKGKACNAEAFGLPLYSYNYASIPHFPNYRLGPLDGSPCDTLGLDNIPVANFRCTADTALAGNFFFTDLSYYEPENWYWDFGDGKTSTAVNPVHFFKEPGVYTVCLTVSNDNGAHTYCKELEIGIVHTTEAKTGTYGIALHPNPATDKVWVNVEDMVYRGPKTLTITDVNGRAVYKQQMRIGQRQQVLSVSDIAAGVYFVRLTGQAGEVLAVEKLVVL